MDIYHTLFWGCAALCAVAELLILRAVFRPAPDAAGMSPHAADVPQSPRGVELFWSVLPIFALVALFWAAWPAVR